MVNSKAAKRRYNKSDPPPNPLLGGGFVATLRNCVNVLGSAGKVE